MLFSQNCWLKSFCLSREGRQTCDQLHEEPLCLIQLALRLHLGDRLYCESPPPPSFLKPHLRHVECLPPWGPIFPLHHFNHPSCLSLVALLMEILSFILTDEDVLKKGIKAMWMPAYQPVFFKKRFIAIQDYRINYYNFFVMVVF